MTEPAALPQAPRRLRSVRFWVLTVATWAMVALTFSLGRWQLGRAEYKQQLAEQMQARMREPALDNHALLKAGDLALDVHRSVQLQGRWLAERTLYLDNRPMQGRPGFWVYTPLQLEGSTRVMLVQRGWIPRDFAERTRLAPVETPAGPVELRGRLALSPGKLYAFEGEDSGRIRQNLNLADHRLETGLDLMGAIAIQLGPASEGLQRQWDAPDLGLDKHRGYAFQWFGLCALLVGLYAWFQGWAPHRRTRAASRRN
jgi:surfeit locus 1 family protein